MRLKKFLKRSTALLTLVTMLPITSVTPAFTVLASENTVVKLSPANASPFNNGIFEGWGTSLCWWANRIGLTFGGNESAEKEEALANEAAQAIFGDDGLSLDIARYNIGGGDDPTHNHIVRSDSALEGFAVGYDDGKIIYDWAKDARQRHILKLATEQNPNLHVEGFANSAPYFMTNSGCTSGNTNASANNLKDDKYGLFAAYLADVTNQFKNEWNIEFKSLSPMNEPDTNYWGANSYKQEGCHFSGGTPESNMINETRTALDAVGLNDVIVAGMDETSIDTTITNLGKLGPTAQTNLGRIDTHTYSGSKRAALKSKALEMGKNLWMSEVDGKFKSGTNMKTGLGFANRVLDDMNGMQPSAWVIWQAIDRHISDYYKSDGSNTVDEKNAAMPTENDSYWGTLIANHYTGKLQYTKKYYAFGQFSRYIEPGDTIIESASNTLAAYNKEDGKIVVVAVNTQANDMAYTFDMSDFSKTGATAKVIRTSGEFSYDSNGNAIDNGESWKELDSVSVVEKKLDTVLKANSITTFIVEPTNETANYISIHGSTVVTLGDELKYTVSTDIENPQITWSTSDESIASVTNSGYLTAHSEGEVTLYAAIGDKQSQITIKCHDFSEISLTPSMMSGSAAWNNGTTNTYLTTIDGNLSTYFDGVTEGYVQIDLGSQYSIGAIGYAPRPGYEYRMRDGYFKASADGENWTTLYTISNAPVSNQLTQVFNDSFTSYDPDATFRYVRYDVPDSSQKQSYNGKEEAYNCNLAEIKLYGKLEESNLKPIAKAIAPDTQIRTNQYMPTKYNDAQITWTSSDDCVLSDGTVTRGTEDKSVTLTANITRGEYQLTTDYVCIVKAKATDKTEKDMQAYLFVHFVGTEGTAESEQVYFSVSKDGNTWNTLNNNKPILTSTLGENGTRDPHIVRSPEGDKFFLIATDLSIYGRRDDSNRWGTCQTSGSKSIMVWESADLVNWSDQRMVTVADKNAGCTWAPESIYDNEKGEYMVFWASKVSGDNYATQRIYRSYTKDFKHFSEPEIYIENDGVSNIDTTFIIDNDTYYRFTKNESKSSVTMMQSNSLSGEFTDISTYTINGASGNTVTGYEGPTAYKLNGEDKWCLLLDYYSKSQGYKPFITDDISVGNFTSAADFSFDTTYRHGTVMPITLSEYNSLLKTYAAASISGESTLRIGDTANYSVSVNNESYLADWSVADELVAAIDPTGLLTALSVGKTEITAYVKDLDITITKTVTIIGEDDIDAGLTSKISFDEENTGSGSFTSTIGGSVKEIGTVGYAEGKFGKALNLSYGENNYVELADGILNGASSATVSFWLNQGTSSNSSWAFMSTPVSGSQTYQSEKYVGLLLDSAKSGITAERYYSSSNARPTQAYAQASLQDWTYVTVIYDTDLTKIYLNGEKALELESNVDLTNLFTASAKSWIGHANWTTGEGFQGMIDEFRLYNRALSETEIQTLYTLDPTVVPTPTPAPTLEPTPTPDCSGITVDISDDTQLTREGDTVSGTIVVNVYNPYFEKTGTLVLASYSDGILTNIYLQDINYFMNRNYLFENVSINAPQFKNNYMKAFLWDSIDTQMPVTKCVTSTI